MLWKPEMFHPSLESSLSFIYRPNASWHIVACLYESPDFVLRASRTLFPYSASSNLQYMFNRWSTCRVLVQYCSSPSSLEPCAALQGWSNWKDMLHFKANGVWLQSFIFPAGTGILFSAWLTGLITERGMLFIWYFIFVLYIEIFVFQFYCKILESMYLAQN